MNKPDLTLARSLYIWTLSSKTKFIEESDELVKKAENLGIKFPNPDLSVFETTYCELGVFNRNGEMLPSDVAKEGLPTLIGKQINFEHLGQGHVCGFIIDARIENNFIIIDGILFKSVWFDEWDKVKSYFVEGKLFVSFELWKKLNGVSVQEFLPDGKRIVRKMVAHGCGLLMKEKPACPKAKVSKLMASEQLTYASEKVDTQENEDIVYAELCIKEECKNCAKCEFDKERRTLKMEEFEDTELFELAADFILSEEDIKNLEAEEDVELDIEEASKLSTEKRKGLKDSDFAVVIKKGDKTIRKYPINDAAHVRNALARLGQEAAKEGLKKLGVSVESVLKKVKSRAKKLGITTASEESLVVTPVAEVVPEVISAAEEIVNINIDDLIEASIPTDVIKKMKALIKEGKSPKEAVKQAWKEHKSNASVEPEQIKKCKNCGQFLGEGQADNKTVTESEYCPGCKVIADIKEGEEFTIAHFNGLNEDKKCSHCPVQHDYQHMQEKHNLLTGEYNSIKANYDKLFGDYNDTTQQNSELMKMHEQGTKEYAEYSEAAKKKEEDLKSEIEKMKEELGKKNQEIADLKITKAAETTKEGSKPSLTVGSTDSSSEDDLKEKRDKINLKAFGHI